MHGALEIGCSHAGCRSGARNGRAPVLARKAEPAQAAEPSRSLLDTGLYVTGSADQVDPDNLPFTPQYPLWSDGADKRRWLNLPPGTWIDASRPGAWEFPAGTRLWKEFSHAGKRIETRLIQRRADKSWLYVSYVWNDEGTDAVLAPADGVVLDNTAAPTGRHEVPSRADCLACHEGAAVPVLGASAVQLSRVRHAQPAKGAVRDPASELPRVGVEALDVQALIERGLLRNFPPSWQRAAARHRGGIGDGAPGSPEDSVLQRRMRSRHPLVQMPPLGTFTPDTEAIALIRRWIANDSPRCRCRRASAAGGSLGIGLLRLQHCLVRPLGRELQRKPDPRPRQRIGQVDAARLRRHDSDQSSHGPRPEGAPADADLGIQELRRPGPGSDLRLPAVDPGGEEQGAGTDGAGNGGWGREEVGEKGRPPTRCLHQLARTRLDFGLGQS